MRQHGSSLVLLGDFNVRSEDWLGSSKTTRAGDYLEEICATHHLSQHVREPTRGKNVPDLVISDFPGRESTTVTESIGRSDHCVVHAALPLAPPAQESVTQRQVWCYGQADWGRLRVHFRQTDWTELLPEDAENACHLVLAHIQSGMRRFIPHKVLRTRPSDPTWWTPECSKAIQDQTGAWKSWRRQVNDASLKNSFTQVVTNAAELLLRARLVQEQATCARLKTGSLRNKEWWQHIKRATELGQGSGIPTLIDSSGKEHATSYSKCEYLGKFFSQKCSLGNNDIDPPP